MGTMSTESGTLPSMTPTESGSDGLKKGRDSTPTADSRGSTAPFTLNEKQNTSLASNDSEQELEATGDEYPTGAKLVSIILALILGIFLASLDMVRVFACCTPTPQAGETSVADFMLLLDYCSHCYTQDYGTTWLPTPDSPPARKGVIDSKQDEFSGLDKVSWYSAAFFMANGGFQSTWGKAYRYFPLKFTFLTSIAVFELGSLICALAPNSTAFIVGRAINGLGAAGIGTGAYTIIAFVTEPSKRATYTGFVGMSFGVACVVGPLIGGVFAEKVTWRWCFWINLPVGGLSAFIILLFFQTPSTAKPVSATWKEKFLQMDPVGVALVMGALVSFMLALQYGGQTAPWNSSLVIGLLVGGVLITAVFAVWERYQGERAILVPRLLSKRPIWVSCSFACIFVGSYYLVIYYLPIYFQSIANASPTMSGVYNLPLIIATTISMISSGMIISATGFAGPIQVVGAVIGMVAAGLLYTVDIETGGVGKWIGYQILGGVGWGLAFQVPIIVGQASADPEDISSVTAMVLFFQCFGGTAFVTAAQAAFVNRLLITLPTTAPGVDSAEVVATGATMLRSAFPADQVPGIIIAYMAGIKVALAVAIGGAGAGLLISLCGRWKRLDSVAVKDAIVAA